MEFLSTELTPAMLGLLPVVIVVLQALKRITFFNRLKQWFPLFGIAISFAVLLLTGTVVNNAVIAAVYLGLAAAKSYDIVKKINVV